MSRATRVEFNGAIYHLMSRGVARMPVFHDDDDRETFLHALPWWNGRPLRFTTYSA